MRPVKTSQDNLPPTVTWGSHVAGLGALALMLSLSYLLVHRPVAAQHRACGEDVGRIEELLAASATIGKQHEDLTLLHADLKRHGLEARQRVPQAPPDAEFLSEAIQIAKEEDLRIVDYQPGTGQDMSTHSEIEIVLRCIGAYDSICGFLDRVAQMPRKFAVKKMTVHTKEGRDIYPFEITLILYYGLKQASLQTQEVSQ